MATPTILLNKSKPRTAKYWRVLHVRLVSLAVALSVFTLATCSVQLLTKAQMRPVTTAVGAHDSLPTDEYEQTIASLIRQDSLKFLREKLPIDWEFAFDSAGRFDLARPLTFLIEKRKIPLSSVGFPQQNLPPFRERSYAIDSYAVFRFHGKKYALNWGSYGYGAHGPDLTYHCYFLYDFATKKLHVFQHTAALGPVTVGDMDGDDNLDVLVPDSTRQFFSSSSVTVSEQSVKRYRLFAYELQKTGIFLPLKGKGPDDECVVTISYTGLRLWPHNVTITDRGCLDSKD